MQVDTETDRALLNDLLSRSNIGYASKSPHSFDHTICGTDDVKEAWVVLHPNAVEDAVSKYVAGEFTLQEFEDILDYALEHRGDPDGAFDW